MSANGYTVQQSYPEDRCAVIVSALGEGEERHMLPITGPSMVEAARAIVDDVGVGTLPPAFMASEFARDFLLELHGGRRGFVTVSRQTIDQWLQAWRELLQPNGQQPAPPAPEMEIGGVPGDATK